MALISKLHRWSLETEGNRATVRTLLFDYRKAFDLIDHSILVKRLSAKLLAKGCYCKWGPVPPGIPQGYQIGPWLFVLMINDLDVNTPNFWKFVDDTTVSEVVPKGTTNEAQSIVNQVIELSHVNKVELNTDKYKELRISFARNPVELDAVVIDRKEVEEVSTAKLLGLTISANLTLKKQLRKLVNDHIS